MSRKKHGMRILYLDIETMYAIVKTWTLFPKYISPNDIIKPGYTLCWAAQWEFEREIMFGRMASRAGLLHIYDLIDEADAIVTYNGKAFDMKHLNKDFVMAGLSPPSSYHNIDLYQTVRARFKLQSNKLDFVAPALGLGRKVKHPGMSLWDDVRAGDPKAWALMERYNKHDVVLTRKLYKRILPWIINHPNVGMWVVDTGKPVCTHCGSKDLQNKGNQYNTKVASYKRYKCRGCGTQLRSRFTSRPRDRTILSNTT